MEKAKAGALVYINQMVKEVERGIETGAIPKRSLWRSEY
ncbi:hypothetical protein ABIC74_003267 [Mucilaginibacter rubeus]